MLEFIDVIDMTTEPDDEGRRQKTSLCIDSKKPHLLTVCGGLKHGTDIIFNGHNAQRLIEHLQQFILKRN